MTGNRLTAAVYDPITAVPERLFFADHREYLARDVDGAVLDVGAGTGAMFPYLADQRTKNGDLDVHAIEPDPHMRRRAERRAAKLSLPATLSDARAESLPYSDGAFDVVIASLVFCTIPDPDAALEEVIRVLAPGGELRFLEHVRDDGWRARAQGLIEPLWKPIAGGCHLTRDTSERFVCSGAFEIEEIRQIDFGITPVRPIVRGTLVRRRDPRESLR